LSRFSLKSRLASILSKFPHGSPPAGQGSVASASRQPKRARQVVRWPQFTV
jgi:hypothetical protein